MREIAALILAAGMLAGCAFGPPSSTPIPDPLATERWSYVTSSDDAEIYVDTTTIERGAVWTRWDYAPGDDRMQMLKHDQYDCSGRRRRLLAWVTYYADGSIETDDQSSLVEFLGDDSWDAVVPGSIDEAVLEVVCG